MIYNDLLVAAIAFDSNTGEEEQTFLGYRARFSHSSCTKKRWIL